MVWCEGGVEVVWSVKVAWCEGHVEYESGVRVVWNVRVV